MKKEEAIEIIKKNYPDSNFTMLREALETLILELKENEDEKIKDAAIEFVRQNKSFNYCLGINKEKVIAWIEKQGKPINILDDADNHKDSLINDTIQSKSKFKVGDWVVFKNKHQSIYQVEKIENGYYILRHTHGGTFRVCILHDEDLRLWSFIVDAKEGDVLASELCNTIMLYKGIEDNNVQFYCDYDFSDINVPFDRFSINKGQHYGSIDDSDDWHPATKEQRNTLMKAMKEAGYEFDFEKKKLKKIGNKFPLLSDFFKAEYERGKADTKKSIKNIVETWKDMRLEVYQQASGNRHEPNYSDDTTKMFSLNDIDEIIEKMSEQKPTNEEMKETLRTEYEKGRADVIAEMQNPAWSEEDETKLITAQTFIRNTSLIGNDGIKGATIDWLNDLKNRVQSQPKQEWSKEDKVMLDDIIDFFENGTVKLQHDLSLYASWLKSLKGRVQPPKKEWSEEDERLFQIVIDILDRQNHLGNISRTDLIACVRKLKSLKDKYTWKPSDEQMDALDYYANSLCTYCDRQDDLRSLFNDLKNLRKE